MGVGVLDGCLYAVGGYVKNGKREGEREKERERERQREIEKKETI